MKRLSIFALVLIMCAAAFADMSRFNPPDPRLDKKVTLDVNNSKLEEVAKSLTEQTGITIKAGSGQRDWKVRERTVTIHAKDIAAGKLMDDISRVLGFHISREGKDKEWSYIIWQDKKSRDLEAEMITAQKEADARHIKESRQATVDAAADVLKMSPEDALKLKDKDPWTAYMGGTKTGRGYASLISSLQSQFPTEYDLMMRGKRSSFPLTGLPTGMQKSLQEALSGGLATEFKGRMGDMAKDLTPVQLTSMPMDGMMNSGMAGELGLSSFLFISGTKPGDKFDGNQFGGMPMTFFPMVAPNSIGAAAFGALLLDVESGTSFEDAGKKLESKFSDPAVLAGMLAHDSPTEKEPPTNPELTREVELKADALPKANKSALGDDTDHEAQGKVVAEISRALGKPVLMESFNRVMPLSVFITAGKQPVYNVLITLEKANYTWDLSDGSLTIRPNDWSLRRSYLIPDSFLAYYRDLLVKQEILTLDDLTAIATGLTDDQIQQTLLTDPDFSFLMMSMGGGMIGGSRDMLRLYGSFTANQKESLQSEAGLVFGQLTDAQWDQLNKIITDHFGGIYVADGVIKMVPPGNSPEKTAMQVCTFNIDVAVTGEEKPRNMIQTVIVPGKDQIAQMQKMRKQIKDNAKTDNKNADAKPADPDAPKPSAPAAQSK